MRKRSLQTTQKQVRGLMCASTFAASIFISLAAHAQTWPWPWSSNSSNAEFTSRTKLPNLNGDSKEVTISGISAGAYMAIQMHIAFSSTISGVGSIAGGPWNCSGGDLSQAQNFCMANPSKIRVASIIQQLKKAEANNEIDALSNLVSARVYLYNSLTDTVVREPMNAKTKEFYSNFVPAPQIQTEQTIPSAHGMPTLAFGNRCGDKSKPYMNNCGFDAAGEVLKSVYGNDASALKRVAAVRSSLKTFIQTEFADAGVQLAPAGWIYVPRACSKGGCPVHVAFHGCLQSAEHVQATFVTHAGYNEWAEGSGLIIIYPQARTSYMNPNGCFDWWGYTGQDYANRKGPQMKAVKAMIDRVLGF